MSARPPGVAVLVFNYDSQGGMERQAARLAEGLAARGLRVTVVTTFAPAGLGLPLPKRPLRREWIRDVRVVRVPLLWWTFEGAPRLFEAWAATALRRYLGELDVLYAVHSKTGCHAVAASRALGLPVLVKLACSGEIGDLAALSREPDARRLRALLHDADRVLCLSNELELEALAAGLARERLARVKNGVDLVRFRPEGPKAALPELAAPGEVRRLILAVGRLDQQKRLDVLLRAFARVLAKVPGARLALAGEGPLAQELRELTRTLGLEGKVAFLGARDDVPDLLRAAEAFVLASESEGLSNALLEALASGVPVVASAIAANRELVMDEREGLLVPVGDVDELAAALERLLLDRALAARLGAAGRELALEHDHPRVVERHRALFAEVARAGRRRASVLALLGLWAAALLVCGRAILRQAWRRVRGTGRRN